MHTRACSTGLVAGLLSIALAGTAPLALAADETLEAWRLFVTDQADATVSVLDPDEGALLASFPTTGYVTHLVPSTSGETVFAVQMDHDVVHVLASGIRLSAHGDHSDIEVTDASLLPIEITGARPVHAVMHGDQAVQFFDREGEARVYSEKGLLSGDDGFTAIVATAPHHGVAVPMGAHFLISEPDLAATTEPGALPPRLGLKVLDQNGQQVGETAICTGLHGEADSGGIVAFGCVEGVLVARPDGTNPPRIEMLAYAEAMPEGRVGTLAGGKVMQFFLGDYGADKLVLIDPSSDEPFRVVDLPVRHVHFVLDPVQARLAYVVTEDGRLSALDVLSGEIVRSASITEPYSKDGHWRDPRPRLAVMGDRIAVTDPRAGLVRLVDAESFVEVGTLAVEGLPFNIAAIGGSGLQH